MLPFMKKYLRAPPKRSSGTKEQNREEQEATKAADAPSPCVPGCWPAHLLSLAEPSNQRRAAAATTTRILRSNFAKSTTSSVFPNTHFTNHESLPSLMDAFTMFARVFPQYESMQEANGIRESEYRHLLNHICLDYSGIGLFSYAQMNASVAASTSSAPLPSGPLEPPFFDISYKSASLKSQVQYRDQDTSLESEIRRRIMRLLNVSEEDYSMVCTANRTTAFRLLAESYQFHSNNKLLTVYDYESEAVTAMADTAQRKGARVMSACFTWPSLRINSVKLRRKLTTNKKQRGLFVFPLLSRMTGARYPYLWMSLAQENRWHIVLDACALGPKDLDTLGVSLIRPDFIVCNFYKVFGENPTGFAGLFIKKSTCDALETSTVARSIGVVSIIPIRRLSQREDDHSSTEFGNQSFNLKFGEEEVETASSFSGPIGAHASNEFKGVASSSKEEQVGNLEHGETSEFSEIVEVESADSAKIQKRKNIAEEVDCHIELECRGLEHADALGLVLINRRLRCLTNWLFVSLLKLRHPHSENGHSLVKIYGPRVKFDRGPALAFNLFDWKGEKIEPSLVQKLADRSNISLSCGFLQNIRFEDKYEAQKKDDGDTRINVINASLGFLTNFEDVYRLWAFIAKFLDADFVEKERWRYIALNQKMVEV